MMMHKTRVYTLFLLVAITSVYGDRGEVNDGVDWVLANDAATRREAVNRVLTERSQLISSLVDAVVDKGSDKEQWRFGDTQLKTAVVLLGKLRATEAVSVLGEHIGKGNDGKEGGPGLVAQALISIGNPSLPAVLSRIRDTDDTTIIWECTQIIQQVEGRALGRVLLEMEREKTRDQGHARNIDVAIRYFE